MTPPKLSSARIERAKANPDNPALKWDVVCSHSSLGEIRLPFPELMLANNIACFVNTYHRLPTTEEIS